MEKNEEKEFFKFNSNPILLSLFAAIIHLKQLPVLECRQRFRVNIVDGNAVAIACKSVVG